MINLGDKVKDTITGFTGIVIAKVEWLNGCRRYTVQRIGLNNGVPSDSQGFDEIQLKVIAKNAVPVTKPVDTGGPRPEPRRARDPQR